MWDVDERDLSCHLGKQKPVGYIITTDDPVGKRCNKITPGIDSSNREIWRVGGAEIVVYSPSA